MKNLSEINTASQEGKLLMMALAALTVSPAVQINKKEVNGRTYEPDQMLAEIVAVAKDVYPDYETQHKQFEEPTSFEKQLEGLINKHSKENDSNTPDFVLAEFLNNCLSAFNTASNARQKWYGVENNINATAQPMP